MQCNHDLSGCWWREKVGKEKGEAPAGRLIERLLVVYCHARMIQESDVCCTTSMYGI